MFCTFLCDPELSGIFQSEDLLWSYFQIKSLQKITKKANLLKFIGLMGVDKNLSYFLRLPSAFADSVAPWVFPTEATAQIFYTDNRLQLFQIMWCHFGNRRAAGEKL